ncbi:N-acetylglucosamine kinase [Subtercola boreus]|uniref:ATPase BadF/BadG/BcrA/BcrD type domain-containing protein n=1 Tax=Subtercola boreus TaxID=120213 RepID=A0A3E0WA38_9MICO|nr:BadF/BadG/BcrA/BcrD ATPase family protein [Subtercola boreus]RFA18821.1 hypothetical protein B7R24_13875 [Subtercola boreus]RFA18935.1 hypothetical protein B7R23_13865 [Subtercola boreus]RFA25473.1 hypothetical protein B7R25_13975 [Subtercola boreus]
MRTIAVDIGQTQSRARVTDSETSFERAYPGFVYGSDLAEFIASTIVQIARSESLGPVEVVAVGATGLYGSAPQASDLISRIAPHLTMSRLLLADDAVPALLGAFSGAEGVAVAAGTGTVGLGYGPTGAARVDGAGSMIGDNGSGWWIGRAGIIAALSAHDGRAGGSHLLLAALEERFGNADDFPRLISAQGSPVATVATFAEQVSLAARRGDSVAQQIWVEAARHLGNVVLASATRAGLSDGFQWTILGGVGRSQDLLEPFLSERIAVRFRHAVHVQPQGSVLDGVAVLQRLDPITPFGRMVTEWHE